jgi:hypothetical protein
MKKYLFNFSITINGEGVNEEQAEDNAWHQLQNLLAVSPSIRDFSCHNYGMIADTEKENND